MCISCATVDDEELGATVDNDYAWFYIPYDN